MTSLPSAGLPITATSIDSLLCLSDLLLRLIHLNPGMFGKDVGMAYQAREMCCKIIGGLPQHAFFQLLTCWAQRQKLDFAKDAINTLVALNSHFLDQYLTNFLLESRDFKIQPPSRRRQESSIHVSFICTPKHKCIVDTICQEIQLMYWRIATTHNVFFFKFE